MRGNSRPVFVLQERDRHLLRELGTMRIIDREQAKLVAGFGSTTRANTRLLKLTRAGLLKRTFIGTIVSGRKAVYTLAAKGRLLVDARLPGLSFRSGSTVMSGMFFEHQLQINEVFLTAKYRGIPGAAFLRWISFAEPLSAQFALKPDGYFELNCAGTSRNSFLEVDLGTEALKIWDQKAQLYIRLAVSGEFTRRFSQSQFRVLVITTTERRVENIRAAVSRVTDKLFWFTTFDLIQRQGFWNSVWLRPRGNERVSLL